MRANQLAIFAIWLFLCSCGSAVDPLFPFLPPGSSSIPAGNPSFDRPFGFFVVPILVTISTDIQGATLEYTTDGIDPTCESGEAHTAPKTISVSSTTTLKAISCMDGGNELSLAQAPYTIAEATYTKLIADIRVDPLSSLTPIQDAIDVAVVGDIVYIPAGIYSENDGPVNIDKQITLIGAGSGDDPALDTIVRYADPGENVLFISKGGTSPTERVAIRNMKVTEAQGTGNDGTGIEIGTAEGHIEIDNVTVTGNLGNGIAFNIAATDTQDILVKNCLISNNGNHGFRVPSSLDNIDGLTIENCLFEGNTGSGGMFLTLAINLGDVTNITIQDSTFIGNASGSPANGNGDLVFSSFNGNVTLSNITIESNASESGIRLTGKSNGSVGKLVAGNMILSNITINGMQQMNGTYPSAALVISRYLGLLNVTLNDMVLGSQAPHGLFIGTITNVGEGPDLGNLDFEGVFSAYDIKLGRHGNSGSYDLASTDIDATGATFKDATSDADIETRVFHKVDDAALGLVTWTTP